MVSVQLFKLNCRVGKGRPAGSIELRVSPSSSKIPYGGFSPVRLQMDRQWRPSTTSQGLSAVHIRPMTPSYTPPQFLLPEVRDPRRDFPVVEPFGSMWHDSQQRQHVHPEALGSPSGSVVPAGHRLLRPHPPLWIPLRRLWIRGGGCCTQGYRLGVGIQRFPNLLRWTVLACRLPYPGGPRGAHDCCFPLDISLHPFVTGSATTFDVSGLQSSF